ncbi:sulfotransferase 1A1-like [Glandiceps talaboti]
MNSEYMRVYEFKGHRFWEGFMSKKLVEERRANQIKVRDGDVFVTSFQKSGTSWVLHALVMMYDNWGLLELSDRKIAPMPDYFYRVPEAPGVLGEATKKFIATANDIPSPRLFKTHLPPCLFPVDWQEKKGKVIYIARNPKDVCVSSYFFTKATIAGLSEKMESLVGSNMPPWDEYVQMFARGEMIGPWLRHVVEWRQFGQDDNVLHVTYEDLKKDMKSVFEKMANFIGRPLSSEKLDKVVAGCSIEEMRKHAQKELDFDEEAYAFKVNPFFRKGKTGNWKDHFTVAQNEMFDGTIGQGLKEAGINFTYEM